MKKMLFTCLTLVVLTVLSYAQIPDWEDTVLRNITETRTQKYLNNGSLYIDSENLVHVVYLERALDGAYHDRRLYYTVRDQRNSWSVPEWIVPAGTRFGTPNVIVNPETGEVEIYGDIEGVLTKISRGEDEEWVGERIDTDNLPVQAVNIFADGNGNLHIAGVTEVQQGPKIIYLNNLEGNWDCIVVDISSPHTAPLMAKPVISSTSAGRVVIAYLGQTGVSVLQNRAPGHDVWRHEVIRTPMPTDYYFDMVLKGEAISLVTAGQEMWGTPWRQYYYTRYIEDEAWRDAEYISGNDSVNNPFMAIDGESYIHIVGTEISGNVNTGVLKYITNATETGAWEVTNPFPEHPWGHHAFTLDRTNNFQMVVVRSERIGNEFIYEIAHIGAPWQSVLPTPQNLSTSVDSFDVLLVWDDIYDDEGLYPDLSGFNVYRKHIEQESFERINEEIVTDTTYTDIELPPGTYDYYVTAFFANEEESAPSNIARAVIRETLSKPYFDPPSGEYGHVISVWIKTEEGIGNIFYTDDGTDPDENSSLYDGVIKLTETTTLKARCYHDDYYPSEIATAKYIIEMTSTDDLQFQAKTELFPSIPNPFNPDTKIPFNIGETSRVTIDIFSVKGQKVTRLVDKIYTPGKYSVAWNGRDDKMKIMPSGVYYVRMQTDTVEQIRSVVLLK